MKFGAILIRLVAVWHRHLDFALAAQQVWCPGDFFVRNHGVTVQVQTFAARIWCVHGVLPVPRSEGDAVAVDPSGLVITKDVATVALVPVQVPEASVLVGPALLVGAHHSGARPRLAIGVAHVLTKGLVSLVLTRDQISLTAGALQVRCDGVLGGQDDVPVDAPEFSHDCLATLVQHRIADLLGQLVHNVGRQATQDFQGLA